MLEPLSLTRLVTTESALASATFADAAIVLRIAPDEALVIGSSADEVASGVEDPHAIVVDDTGWHGGWMANDDAQRFITGNCTWELPSARPSMAQGRVADAPVKLWLESDRVLFVVPHVAARDLAERMER